VAQREFPSKVAPEALAQRTSRSPLFSLALISRRQHFSPPPMIRLCRRAQRMRRPATKLLPPLNLRIRLGRKTVRPRLNRCLGYSKLGRTRMMRRHRSGRYSPFKIAQHRFRKLSCARHLCGPSKSTHTSGQSIVRGQRCDTYKNPRKKPAREQNARVQVPSAQDEGTRHESEQNAQAPSLLQTYGWSN
jgi:hypothetical protein